MFTYEVRDYLLKFECANIYSHSLEVAKVAEKLCERFGLNPLYGYIGGLLHDIGGIFPSNERVRVAQEMGIDLYKEEIEFPLIIHQRISAILARNEFAIKEAEILKAIECHTTLRKEFTELDLIIFLSDKIARDQSGIPPYLEPLKIAMDSSLEAAALVYIEYLLGNNIKVLHPWLIDGKSSLEKIINKRT